MQSQYPKLLVTLLGALSGSALAVELQSEKPVVLAQAETLDEARLPSVEVTESPAGGLPLDVESQTGTRLGLTVRETPATVDVMTQQQMQELGTRTTQEALNRIPGVTSFNPATSPGLLSIRGFADSAVALNYDGAKPAVPGFFSRVQDTWSFERIEVLKGPSSVMDGASALGGTVNLVPKRAHLGLNERAAEVSYGSFNSIRVAGDGAFALGDDAALRAVASYGRSDGYVDDTRSEFLSASLSGVWRATDRLTLDGAVDYYKDDYDTAYFGTPLVPRSFARDPSDLVSSRDGRVLDKAMKDVNYNVEDATTDSETVWVTAGLKYDLTEAWNLTNKLYWYQSDRRFMNAEFYGFNSTTQLVDRSTGIVTHDFDYWLDRLGLNGDMKIAGLRNRITAGVDYSEVDFFTQRRFGTTTSIDPYNPDRGNFPQGDNSTIFPSRTDQNNSIKTTGFFVEDAINLTDRWLILGGVRQDFITVDRASTNVNTGVSTPVFRKFDPVTGRVGTVFDLLPKTQLFAQYNTVAVPPASLMTLTPANANFNLTTGDAIEAGIKSSLLNDEITTTLSVFRIRQDDIVTRDPNNLTVAVQGGKQSSRGIEIAVSAAVTKQLRIDANYTLLDAKFDELTDAAGNNLAGNTPQRVPEQIGNLFAFYDLRGTPVTLSGGVHYGGSYFTDNANTIRVGSYTTLEAAIAYKLPFGILTLRGRNLTDEFYADYTDISPDQLTIAPPRSFDLTLSMHF